MLEALNDLSPAKQLKVYELWPAPQIQLENDVKITARSKQERRRPRNLSDNRMLGFVIPLQVALLDGTHFEPINHYRSTGAGTSLRAVGPPLDHEGNEFTPVEELASGTVKELLVEIVDHDRAGTRRSSVQDPFERHGHALAETFGHHADDSKSFVADRLFRRSSPAHPTRGLQ